ncbi:hypothetical protein L596_025431 [Steinernema carpocapsae]|uniref:Uncharacterized protein n=1 Tax=Steinernema carpocapsae TaxID=34508 RepID=A0A4V6XVS0_STECR|nr:hypothetical protein L596_025431 [Steinernema carpocapsae]
MCLYDFEISVLSSLIAFNNGFEVIALPCFQRYVRSSDEEIEPTARTNKRSDNDFCTSFPPPPTDRDGRASSDRQRLADFVKCAIAYSLLDIGERSRQVRPCVTPPKRCP